MSTPEKQVVLLLSTYNGEKYLEPCLQSLAQQDWSTVTILARDDGSTDRTVEILRQAQPDLKPGFRLLQGNGNLGPAFSFFRLLQEAGDGFDYYAFCDQDDVWLPDKISRAVNRLEAEVSPEPQLYCSRVQYVDQYLNLIGFSRLPRRIGFGNALVENIATGCTIVLNRSARSLVLEHLPSRCLVHDWWFYLVVSAFGKVLYDEEPRIKYRLHRSNNIGVPVTFKDDASQRLRRFVRNGVGVFRSSDQAAVFLQCFSGRLSPEQRRLLEWMAEGKTSLAKRASLARSGLLWRQRSLDNLILKVLVLINRY